MLMFAEIPNRFGPEQITHRTIPQFARARDADRRRDRHSCARRTSRITSFIAAMSHAARRSTSPNSNRLQLRDEASLNILIPMGGSDEAFRACGYSAPKPMIKIVGRPMLLHLLDTLQLRLGDVVWLIMSTELYDEHEHELNLKAEFPLVDIRVVPFKVLTRGAIETLFIGLQHMSQAELSRRTLCLDCDTLYFADVLGMFRAAPAGRGMCGYFVDTGTAALYSYLRLAAALPADERGGGSSACLVTEVAEKNAISDLANIGAYGFASGAALRTYIQQARSPAPGLSDGAQDPPYAAARPTAPRAPRPPHRRYSTLPRAAPPSTSSPM